MTEPQGCSVNECDQAKLDFYEFVNMTYRGLHQIESRVNASPSPLSVFCRLDIGLIHNKADDKVAITLLFKESISSNAFRFITLSMKLNEHTRRICGQMPGRKLKEEFHSHNYAKRLHRPFTLGFVILYNKYPYIYLSNLLILIFYDMLYRLFDFRTLT